jgi:hypothetical protein
MDWDRYDIVEAYYAFYTDYHGGKSSSEYIRLCHILTYFKPSPLFKGYESLSENGKEIYDNLVLKFDNPK